MAKRSKRPNGGFAPGKMIAIGILSVMLLLAIVAQFGRRKKDVAEPAAPQTAAENSADETSSETAAPVVATPREETTWPTFNLAKVVASNPFTLPEALRPAREAVTTLTPNSEPWEDKASIAASESDGVREMRRRQAEFMTSLRSKGVDMILRSPRGSVARIGELSLRVGDVHEGLRVEAIGTNGVVFAPAVVVDGQLE